MGNGHYKLDVARTLTTYFLFCYLNTATVTYNAAITYALVFSAGTLKVLSRTEDTLAEETISLGFVCSVVDGFWFCNLTERVLENLFRRSESNCNLCEITLYLSFFLESHIDNIVCCFVKSYPISRVLRSVRDPSVHAAAR